MKTITTIALLLFLVLPALSFGQVIQLETGVTHKSDHISVAITSGFINFQGDTFTGGVIVKQYRGLKRVGAKIGVSISLNKWSYIYSTGDVFIDKYKVFDSTFLEIGTGVGIRLAGVGLSAGYKMQDFNPVTLVKTDDLLSVKLNYQIRWKK